MAIRVSLAADVYHALHAGSPDDAAATPKRRGSGTHHARKPPCAQLFRMLSECLAHYELNQPRHDEMAKRYAGDLMTGLHRLGLLK